MMKTSVDEMAPSSPTAAKQIVLVDDDETVLEIMTEWLNRAGHHVTAFSEFTAAKTYLAQTTPDVLVADVRLGAFNGLHLVIRAKSDHPEMSAIVLTGYDDPVLRKETSGVGVEFLMKPVRAVQLLDAINQPA